MPLIVAKDGRFPWARFSAFSFAPAQARGKKAIGFAQSYNGRLHTY